MNIEFFFSFSIFFSVFCSSNSSTHNNNNNSDGNSSCSVHRHFTQQVTTTMVESESDRLLRLGLEIVGSRPVVSSAHLIQKNLSCFRSAFGVGPDTVAQILNDLSQHEIEEEPDAVWLLIALNWIRVYNTCRFLVLRWWLRLLLLLTLAGRILKWSNCSRMTLKLEWAPRSNPSSCGTRVKSIKLFP
jgi:hypothetical protein